MTLAVDPSRTVRHEIEPCRCPLHFAEQGETCARCGRYSIGALIEAAVSWYPPIEDPVLRSFRGAA